MKESHIIFLASGFLPLSSETKLHVTLELIK